MTTQTTTPPVAPEPYVAPATLPPPLTVTPGSPTSAVVTAILVAAGMGIALFIAGQMMYVYILYNCLIGAAIGWALARAPEKARYTDGGLLFMWAVACSVLAYGVYQWIACEVVRDEIQEPGLTFWQFLYLRAEHQPFLGSSKPGVAGNVLIWIVEIGITMFCAWGRIEPAIRAAHVESVPTEVTEMVVHFLAEGKDGTQIRNELAQRGWTSAGDQQRALLAAESVVLMLQAQHAQAPASQAK